MIVTTGIARVVYQTPYRLADGLSLLTEAGIAVEQLEFTIDYNTVAFSPQIG